MEESIADIIWRKSREFVYEYNRKPNRVVLCGDAHFKLREELCTGMIDMHYDGSRIYNMPITVCYIDCNLGCRKNPHIIKVVLE